MVKRLSKRLTDLHPPNEAALIRRVCENEQVKGLIGEANIGGLESVADNLDANRELNGVYIMNLSADDLAKYLSGEPFNDGQFDRFFTTAKA